MTHSTRRHIAFDTQTLQFLEQYQERHGLPSFSATIEAAAAALQERELREGYERFARDYAGDEQARQEAEAWLGLPMQEQG
ncbi:hypothetical protein [Deinococcus radiophilus]|uniref:CopG family transcriptional regulator n=1 Tax=Deinococcus radiophilus TaxID=32062 RepID=A0A3S0KAJ1_9DEIO|nr:hypothetical protein [Deinococcus radiophilus]RTR19241.1 hypothetical protein EJ104_13495 [Deinococcus radiophilus]UFA51717.1 hypothetical protein LMT64_12735 [Deinococcus radiophilus]